MVADFSLKNWGASSLGWLTFGLTLLLGGHSQSSEAALRPEISTPQSASAVAPSVASQVAARLPLAAVQTGQAVLIEPGPVPPAPWAGVSTPQRDLAPGAAWGTGCDRTLSQGVSVSARPSIHHSSSSADRLPEDSTELPQFSTSAADLAGHPPDSTRPQLPIQAQPKGHEKALDLSFAKSGVPLGTVLFAPQPDRGAALSLAQTPVDPEAPNPEEEDPELGIIRIRSATADPELGIIRIREQPVIPAETARSSTTIAFLTGRVSIGSSGNIFLASDPLLGLVGDQFVRPGVTLGIYPALGPETYLLASADLSFQRYFNVTSINYDEVRFRLGVRQALTPRSYGQLTWSYQQLFRPGLKDRFFENDSVELFLARRDPLTPEIALNSYYQLQLNFSDPGIFDRIVQFAGVYASYQISPQLQAGLTYQITLADYTSFERFDTYQQVLGQIVYQVIPEVRVTLYGGFSFGQSSLPNVRFEDTIIGITFEGTVGLF